MAVGIKNPFLGHSKGKSVRRAPPKPVRWPGEIPEHKYVFFEYQNHADEMVELMGLAGYHQQPDAGQIVVILPITKKYEWMNDSSEAKKLIEQFRQTDPQAICIMLHVPESGIDDQLIDEEARKAMEEIVGAMNAEVQRRRDLDIAIRGDDSVSGRSPFAEALSFGMRSRGLKGDWTK